MTAAPHLSIIHSGNSFFVLRDGVEIYGPASHNQAQEKLEKLKRDARKKIRPCLTCSQPFLSTGPGHRMCTACRSASLYEGYA